MFLQGILGGEGGLEGVYGRGCFWGVILEGGVFKGCFWVCFWGVFMEGGVFKGYF